jgi:hypothetical protein
MARMATVTVWLVAVGLGLAAGDARAQLCGDADGNGSVTVSDGVQALRAAAELSSSCTPARCDVDGNGAISLADGVNVLRKAAELPIAGSCAVSTTEAVGAFLGEMTKIARIPISTPAHQAAARTGAPHGGAIASAVRSDCDEGFLETDGDTTTFFECRFDQIVINGAVTSTVLESDPDKGFFKKTDTFVRYEVRFLDTSFTFRQDGTMTIAIDTQANRLIEDGTLTVFHAASASGQEEYTLTKRNLVTDTLNGTVLTGELVSALAQAGLAGIKAVTLAFATGVLADVDVEFDDGRFERFVYNLETNALTPAKAAGVASVEGRRDAAGRKRGDEIARQERGRRLEAADVRVHVGETESAREMIRAVRRA